MANKNQILKREYIPLVIAGLVLVLLIVALVFTIINKPKKVESPITYKSETPTIDEKVVPSNTCSGEEYDKLKEEVKNIEARYVVNDHYDFGCAFSTLDELPDDPNAETCSEDEHSYGYALDVYLSNIPEKARVVVTNDQDDSIYVYENNNGEDSYVWSQPETTFLRVYNFKVYSNAESCNDKLLREFNITLPRWNEVSKTDLCITDEYKDTDVCQRFVFDKYDLNKDYEKSKKIIEKVEKKKQEDKKEKEEEKKSNVIIIICVIAIIVVLGVGIVFVLMKGRKKHEKK